MEYNPQLTILVFSCDKYLDELAIFARLFKKYWPDCPSKRGRPPLFVRFKEWLKGVVFNTVSPTFIVKVQNRFGWGAK